MIIKIDSNTFIDFNEDTRQSVTLFKDQLEQNKQDFEKRLKDVVTPTDEEYIKWAKANMPVVDHTAEISELERINNLLDKTK